jgi:hypothetical protein
LKKAGRGDGPVPNPATYLADTGTTKGQGVFASRDFMADELVEMCEVVAYRIGFDDLTPELQQRVFNWSIDEEPMPLHVHALGNGSFYNHANPANMRYEADRDALEIRFFTVVPVGKDTELTINYNAEDGGPTWNDDYWFREMKIEPI